MKTGRAKRPGSGKIVFILFILMNLSMLSVSLYTLYFSAASPFADSGIARSIPSWSGFLKNIILLSGLWIFIDIAFTIFFFFKRK